MGNGEIVEDKSFIVKLIGSKRTMKQFVINACDIYQIATIKLVNHPKSVAILTDFGYSLSVEYCYVTSVN